MLFSHVYWFWSRAHGSSTESTFVLERSLLARVCMVHLPYQPWLLETYSDFWVVRTVHLPNQPSFFDTYTDFWVVRTVHLPNQPSFWKVKTLHMCAWFIYHINHGFLTHIVIFEPCAPFIYRINLRFGRYRPCTCVHGSSTISTMGFWHI